MRSKEVMYKDEKSIMIYIGKDEENDKIIQNKIKEYKSKYENVAIFIGGDIPMEIVLTKIIQDEYDTLST